MWVQYENQSPLEERYLPFRKVERMKAFSYLGKEVIFDFLEGDQISKNWLKGSFYELELLEWIKSRELKGTYVDVGSHHGNHVVYYSLFCKADKVIGIEGSPFNFRFLETNVKLNQLNNVVLHNAIASNVNEEVDLHYNLQNTGNTSFYHFNKANEKSSNESKLLDDLLEHETDISLMKFDIENMEWFALDGCKKVLKKHSPMIFIEWNIDNPHLSQINELFKVLNYHLIETLNVPSTVHIYERK